MNCDFDCWIKTDATAAWLWHHKATILRIEYGFIFWENPVKGDEAPVFATTINPEADDAVWNTQDFDLPIVDPMQEWS